MLVEELREEAADLRADPMLLECCKVAWHAMFTLRCACMEAAATDICLRSEVDAAAPELERTVNFAAERGVGRRVERVADFEGGRRLVVPVMRARSFAMSDVSHTHRAALP